MKKGLLALGILGSVAAYGIAPGFYPPITEGSGSLGSSTEVRITANVVQTVAINESNPIDFGNLVRGMYLAGDVVSARTPGGFDLKGEADASIKVTADKTTEIALDWVGANGTVDSSTITGAGTRAVIDGVTVLGMGQDGAEATDGVYTYTLDGLGLASDVLTAEFEASAYNGTGNLSSKQKLGAYKGQIVLTAVVEAADVAPVNN